MLEWQGIYVGMNIRVVEWLKIYIMNIKQNKNAYTKITPYIT